MTPPVVIYVNGVRGASQKDSEAAPEHSGTSLPGNFPHDAHGALLNCGARYDPHRVRRDFPERWSAYIRKNYSSYSHVCQVFGVCERTARKWWEGETGANGGHVAVAVNEHGEIAHQMLFAAE